ncbi:MAG: alpha/beta hydrolase-fold protein [Bryobacteraceae bacterium]
MLLVSLAFAQSSEDVQSPRIERLRVELSRSPEAVEQFWREVRDQGSPLIESVKDDPISAQAARRGIKGKRNSADLAAPRESVVRKFLESVLVTFLLRGGADLRPIVFASVLSNNDPLKQQLVHLSGTDVWYRTYRFRRDLPILYELSVDGPKKLQRDPLNARHIEGSMGGSLAILPGVRNLEWSQKRNVAHGRVDAVRFRSERLNNERSLRVYLPAAFDRRNLYNVLVMLDEDVYSGPVPLATILDNLTAAQRIRPTVAVLVGNTDRASELSCSPEFSAMLADELLPWVEERYALKRNRDRTTIAGSSLGGLAAACAGWRESNAFANVIALSGSFRWRPGTESEPEWFARQLAASPSVPVRFVIGVGSHETGTPPEPANPSLLTANRHLRDVLRAKRYAFKYQEFAGAHEPLSWRSAIVDSLIAAQE